MIVNILLLLIALLHLYILYMEMFAWTTLGRRTFGRQGGENFYTETKVMAANQGLYNGILAAGLLWALLIEDPSWSNNVALFFLSAIAVAGLYGGFTAGKKIILFQTVPALITILLIILKI